MAPRMVLVKIPDGKSKDMGMKSKAWSVTLSSQEKWATL